MARKKIGELLVEAGLVSDTQVGAALSEQQNWGGKVGIHLVKMGALTTEELVAILSRQLDVQRIDFHKSLRSTCRRSNCSRATSASGGGSCRWRSRTRAGRSSSCWRWPIRRTWRRSARSSS